MVYLFWQPQNVILNICFQSTFVAGISLDIHLSATLDNLTQWFQRWFSEISKGIRNIYVKYGQCFMWLYVVRGENNLGNWWDQKIFHHDKLTVDFEVKEFLMILLAPQCFPFHSDVRNHFDLYRQRLCS